MRGVGVCVCTLARTLSVCPAWSSLAVCVRVGRRLPLRADESSPFPPPPIRRRRSACVRWTAARAQAARSDPALSTRRLSGCSACACSCPPGPRRLPPAASGSGGARRGGPGLGHRGFPSRIPFWLFLVPVATAMLAASPRDAVFAAGCPSASLVGSPASLQHFLEECAESGPVACFASGQSVALLCVRSCFG